MSMRTYLLLLYEKETGLDYWVDAITRRGPTILRDDVLGICKFSGMPNGRVAEALRAITGLAVAEADLERVVRRTYLRGWRIERRQGYGADDYSMPSDVHRERKEIGLPHFITPEFFAALRDRVVAEFDKMAAAEGLPVGGAL
jgi:aldehyde:ferredoxin oxidoreductase